jgi:hypothetical protein
MKGFKKKFGRAPANWDEFKDAIPQIDPGSSRLKNLAPRVIANADSVGAFAVGLGFTATAILGLVGVGVLAWKFLA